MNRRTLLVGLSALAAAACGRPGAAGPKPAALSEQLAALARRYEALMTEHGLYEWERYAGKSVEGPAAQAAMERLRRAEADVFAEATRLLDVHPRDAVAPRERALWQAGALGLSLLGDPEAARLADELEHVINDHHFELDGRRLTRSDLSAMRRSPDATVRRSTRSIEHGLHRRTAAIARKLLQRRQRLARQLGVTSFHAALTAVRGVDADARRELSRVEERTRGPMQRLRERLKTELGLEQLAPWDLEHAVERSSSPPLDERFPAERAMDAAFGLYRAFGIDLNVPRLDITVRDFAFGGQAVAVRVPGDARLVVRPMPGARFYTTLIHELGHAYAITRTEAGNPLYAGYEWVPGLMDPAYAEGVAEVFGRLFDVPDVLREHFGLDEKESEALIAQRRLQALVSARRTLAQVELERALHDAPEGDLDALSLEVERRFGPADLPEDAEPVWATTPFIATYPGYTQSYLLAAMVAVQVREALQARFADGWLSPAAGEFLTQAFVRDGAKLTLGEKLRRTTGRGIDAGPLLEFTVPAR